MYYHQNKCFKLYLVKKRIEKKVIIFKVTKSVERDNF